MTIDEALRKVGGYRYYCVTWEPSTGEIVSVEGVHEDAACRAVSGGGRCSRWLPAEEITRELLEEEREARLFASQRGAICDSYLWEETERLLALLETADYPEPMDEELGSHRIVEELFYYRRNELTGAIRERLRAFQPWLPGENAARLRYYLAALDGDAAALAAEWRRMPMTEREGFDLWALIECVGVARVADRQVVDDLVETVGDRFTVWGIRKSAALALGRIGPAAGSRALETVWRELRREMMDELDAFRERICRRIGTAESAWHPCVACDWGRLREVPRERSWGAFRPTCPVCLGLMVVPMENASEGRGGSDG